MLDIELVKGRYFKEGKLWAKIVGGLILDEYDYSDKPEDQQLHLVCVDENGLLFKKEFRGTLKTQAEAPEGVIWI